MIPNDYDLWLDQQAREAAATTAVQERTTPTPEQVQIASAVGFIESAQAEVAKARRALVLAGEDPTGLDRISRDLDREHDWLRGGREEG